METIPVDLQPNLLRVPIDRYPVYLLEVDRNFTYNSAADIAVFVSELKIQDDDDWCYGNIYYFDRDWQSPRAGKDYMGATSHFHLNKKHIFGIRDTGITAYF